MTTPHTLAFHCTLVLTRGIQGLGVEIHWGLSRRVPWVRVGRHHHPPGVEAQRLGVVWVEGVMQIDDGGYASCQSCILYICSWQRQRPGCTGAAEQIGCVCTHTQSSRENPPRQKTREGRPQCTHDHVQAWALSQNGCMVMPLSHGTLGLP